MVLIVTITDSETENEMMYNGKEVSMNKILTSNALAIARVIVSGRKVEDVLNGS